MHSRQARLLKIALMVVLRLWGDSWGMDQSDDTGARSSECRNVLGYLSQVVSTYSTNLTVEPITLLTEGCFSTVMPSTGAASAHHATSSATQAQPAPLFHMDIQHGDIDSTIVDTKLIKLDPQWRFVTTQWGVTPTHLAVAPQGLPMSQALEQISLKLAPLTAPASRPRLFHVLPVASPEEWTFVLLHLLMLRDVVDTFVLMEAISTYATGRHKPLFYHQLMRHVPLELRGRVRHFIVPAIEPTKEQEEQVLLLYPFSHIGPAARVREVLHRNYAIEALMEVGAHRTDLVVFADADELIDGAVLSAVKDTDGAHVQFPLHLGGPMYRYEWHFCLPAAGPQHHGS